jgi:AbiV family abortive infection protein
MVKKPRRPISLPNDQEARRGAVLALSNAKRHLRSASVLGANRLYGPGSSHVILALEELAKAQILGLIVSGFVVPKNLTRAILQNHAARHNVTFGLLLSQIVRSIAINALLGTFKSGVNLETLVEKAFKKALNVRRPLSASTQLSFEHLDWITKSNEIKKRGFYVDFKGDEWIHPGMISRKSFVFGYSLAERLLKEQDSSIRRILKNGFRAPEAVRRQTEEIINGSGSLDDHTYAKQLIKLILS